MLVDRDGQKIGKLQDVYDDVENAEPPFRLGQARIHRPPPDVRAWAESRSALTSCRSVAKALVETAPNIELHGEELSQPDESALYHQF
jgi:hypothetical protein